MTLRNRGKQSNDDKLFTTKWQSILKEAIDDSCYLLSRRYNENSALQLIGNRYKLNKRQRDAMLRVCCSNQQAELRRMKAYQVDDLENKMVEIDGFNLLILLESAMSGAYVFKARDGIYRDILSIHGSYKRVEKTELAIILVGEVLNKIQVKSVKWYLDKPVSNSGRLKSKLLEIAADNQFNWSVELVFDPDKALAESENIIVSSDGWVIDQASKWFNLGAFLIENYIKEADIIVL